MDKEKRVIGVDTNRGAKKANTICLEAYVLSKALFIELVKKAAATSSLYWFKDILKDSLGELRVQGYSVRGFVACINSLPEYYRWMMALRDPSTASGLFKPGWPIYTQTSDSAPTKFTDDAEVKGSVVANGCVIDGTVQDSIISRNVRICHGAYIGEDAKLDHVVVDKYAIIHHVKALKGTDDDLVYVKRRDRI